MKLNNPHSKLHVIVKYESAGLYSFMHTALKSLEINTISWGCWCIYVYVTIQ